VSPLTGAALAAADVAPTGRQAIGIDRASRPSVSPD
jgi:hypothetical protein